MYLDDKIGYAELNSYAAEYKALINAAEDVREREQKPTIAEFDNYSKAEEVCIRVKNRFHNQPNIVAKWEDNRRYCVAKGQEIADYLAPKKAPAPKAAPAAPKEAQPKTKTGKEKAAPKENEVLNTQKNEKDDFFTATTKDGFVTKNASKDVSAETIRSWHRDKPKNKLEELSGMDEIVEKLMAVAGEFGFEETDALLKIKPEKGILLYGYHGNGKTFTIQAFINYLMTKMENMTYIRLRGDQVHASLVGVAEKTIAAAFKEAIDNAPAVLFFDELDNIAPSRTEAKAEHAKRTTNAFLEGYNELVDAKKPVVVFGATNNPWLVDRPAMNRFTIKIQVPLPSEDARRKFLEDRFAGVHIADDITYEEIAADTDNFDFRDMEHLADALANKLKMDAIKAVGKENLAVKEQDPYVKEALKNGVVKINKAQYELVRPMYHPTVTEEERQKLAEYNEDLAKQG